MVTIFSGNSISGKSYIAFFDLDRTISSATSGNALARRGYKKGLIKKRDFAYAFYLSMLYRLNLRDPHKIVDKMVSWVAGVPEKKMNDLCSEIVHEILLPAIYPEARAEIEIHRKNNAHIVILSSALRAVCLDMAADLKADDIVCSDLEAENGFLTGRPVGRLCYGDEKKVRLTEYCNNNNASISDAWYYGDAFTDLAVLSTVGYPRCVNPDKRLRKAARRRKWKILKWNS
jgi:HAD superfamily hydrolase (TIGR01490 family)